MFAIQNVIGVVKHDIGHYFVIHQQLCYVVYTLRHVFYKQVYTREQARFAKCMLLECSALLWVIVCFVFFQASLALECIWTHIQNAHIEGQHM